MRMENIIHDIEMISYTLFFNCFVSLYVLICSHLWILLVSSYIKHTSDHNMFIRLK